MLNDSIFGTIMNVGISIKIITKMQRL